MSQVDKTSVPHERIENKMSNGEPFDHDIVRLVWEKAVRHPGFETFSLDHRGNSISRFEYGKRSSYGWVIDRLVPLAEGGTDDVSNLIPLHWKHTVVTTKSPQR